MLRKFSFTDPPSIHSSTSTLYHGYAVYVRYTSVYFRILFAYATEADLINVALFGMIAKQWRDVNPGATSIFFQLCFNVSGLFFVLLKTSATETRANLRVNSNRDRTTSVFWVWVPRSA